MSICGFQVKFSRHDTECNANAKAETMFDMCVLIIRCGYSSDWVNSLIDLFVAESMEMTIALLRHTTLTCGDWMTGDVV